MNSVIRLEGVTKTFRLYTERNATLKDKFLYAGRSKFARFVALDDVSMQISRGTVVGLIGPNGSGKSTSLKLMSRILYPDRGNVTVNGRVSSLLELGAGFHPDFTGRENIVMNGALFGLSKREINMRMAEIIEFSELIDFIDQPLRSYSSGMYMRLAFSVAIAVDPEILLVDEILAVGDAAFQAKCLDHMGRLRQRNKTFVIVSHDTTTLSKFCDRAIWLERGKIVEDSEAGVCIDHYLDKALNR